MCLCFFSHGFSNPGGDAGNASHMEQLQSSSQWQNQTNAVARHVRHSCEMEEVRMLRSKYTPLFKLNMLQMSHFETISICQESLSTKHLIGCQLSKTNRLLLRLKNRRSRPASSVVRPDARQESQSRLQQSHQSHPVSLWQ